jgi:hypothetical protein
MELRSRDGRSSGAGGGLKGASRKLEGYALSILYQDKREHHGLSSFLNDTLLKLLLLPPQHRGGERVDSANVRKSTLPVREPSWLSQPCYQGYFPDPGSSTWHRIVSAFGRLA